MNDSQPLALIVSSEVDFGTTFALGLRSGGVDVERALSFDDAAEMIRLGQPDLVIADLATQSFGVNAVIAMGEAIRETGARLVVLTSKVSGDTSLCASLLGASGCLNKCDPIATLVPRVQFLTRYAARNRKHGVVFDNSPQVAATRA